MRNILCGLLLCGAGWIGVADAAEHEEWGGGAVQPEKEAAPSGTAFLRLNNGVFLVPAAGLSDALRRYRDNPRLRATLAAARQDPEMTAPPVNIVADKPTPPPDGDPHSYWSMGPYWHPNPDTQDGLPYIRKDGVVNPVAKRAHSDKGKMNRMTQRVWALSLLAFFEDDADAAGRALEQLRVWFVDPETRMLPHLNFAQAIPGRSQGRGIGIIDTVCMIRVVSALELLATRPEAEKEGKDTLAGVRGWFNDYLDWLLTSPNGLDERSQKNNHGTWYEAQILAYAHACGRVREVVDGAIANVDAHARFQIKEDGSQPHELERTRPWSYSIYNLRAYLSAKTALPAGGGFDPATDAAVERAVDFLLPYFDGRAQWTRPDIDPFKPRRLGLALAVAELAYPEKGYAEKWLRGASADTWCAGAEFFVPLPYPSADSPNG